MPDAWVTTVVSAEPFERMRFLGAYASCGRRFGEDADAVRQRLLAGACQRLDPTAQAELIDEAFYRGDNAERAAVLRALPALPEPARFVEIAIEACRTNVETVFCAIALDNVYPAEHFADANFNQMVLKAVFIGAPVAQIEGLDTRRTPELIAMAESYGSERAAAGRPVPADIELITKRPS